MNRLRDWVTMGKVCGKKCRHEKRVDKTTRMANVRQIKYFVEVYCENNCILLLNESLNSTIFLENLPRSQMREKEKIINSGTKRERRL